MSHHEGEIQEAASKVGSRFLKALLHLLVSELVGFSHFNLMVVCFIA
jgi:hypothetical protein